MKKSTKTVLIVAGITAAILIVVQLYKVRKSAALPAEGGGTTPGSNSATVPSNTTTPSTGSTTWSTGTSPTTTPAGPNTTRPKPTTSTPAIKLPSSTQLIMAGGYDGSGINPGNVIKAPSQLKARM